MNKKIFMISIFIISCFIIFSSIFAFFACENSNSESNQQNKMLKTKEVETKSKELKAFDIKIKNEYLTGKIKNTTGKEIEFMQIDAYFYKKIKPVNGEFDIIKFKKDEKINFDIWERTGNDFDIKTNIQPSETINFKFYVGFEYHAYRLKVIDNYLEDLDNF